MYLNFCFQPSPLSLCLYHDLWSKLERLLRPLVFVACVTTCKYDMLCDAWFLEPYKSNPVYDKLFLNYTTHVMSFELWYEYVNMSACQYVVCWQTTSSTTVLWALLAIALSSRDWGMPQSRARYYIILVDSKLVSKDRLDYIFGEVLQQMILPVFQVDGRSPISQTREYVSKVLTAQGRRPTLPPQSQDWFTGNEVGWSGGGLLWFGGQSSTRYVGCQIWCSGVLPDHQPKDFDSCRECLKAKHE